ncbi:MAG: hypothetical protein IJT24_05315 [Lachnospiraceae bacterium]|nr:hypothetical protein [Lachnospiraceae bacterium]
MKPDMKKITLTFITVLVCVLCFATPACAGTRLQLKDDEAYSGAGMTWDGKTLTLNNCSFSGQIRLPKNSTVAVSGTNTLTLNEIYDESGVLIGQGALTITGGGVLNIVNGVTIHDTCYCIVGKKELTISGVTINASAASTAATDISAGISSRKALKITGSSLVCTGSSNARTSAGIRGGKSIFIQGSNIKASGDSYGIVTSNDAMGISYSNVEASGGKAALKAKSGMQFAGVTGGTPGEKNDRWYVLNGSGPAASVKLTAAN